MAHDLLSPPSMTPRLPLLRRFRLLLILIAVAGMCLGGWYAFSRGQQALGKNHTDGDEVRGTQRITVEVMAPRPGGLDRLCVQPGTVEPFEAADLYAKASGFLQEQNVDIGSRVKKGEILARISVPEKERQVERDEARVRAAEAKVRQMAAHVAAAEAEAKAADASVTFAEVSVRAKASYRKYREKQLKRIKELAAQNAIEAKVVDEQEDYHLSALEAENAALEAVNSARERASAARSKITEAKADLDEAKASAGVAVAEWEASKVLLDYTIIRSPYTGVVTKRTFHTGDFIKSADQGGITPVLAVERTDVMRVVIQVPDRDVPFVSRGDPAVIEIDALPGVVFETTGTTKVEVSRWADAEDPSTRTMRTEVDVKNPDGLLRHGMYGRATLNLQNGAPTAVRIPSGALVVRDVGGKGKVRVVRDDHLVTVPVLIGSDNGVEVEILTGLSPTDRVVVRASGPADEGAAVVVANAQASNAGH